MLGYLQEKEPNPDNFKKFIKNRIEIELRGKEKIGSNRNVFYYQFTDPDEFGLFSLKICLYEGIEAFVAFIPSQAKLPDNVAMELIDSGVKTIITLDGEKYEFN